MLADRRAQALLPVLGALLAVSLAACQPNLPLTFVEVDEAQAALQAGAAALDVRSREEQAAGVLPQARLLPLEEPTFPVRVGSLDRAATYIVYCRTDNRSHEVAEHLVALGFEDVRVLTGGVHAWVAAGNRLLPAE